MQLIKVSEGDGGGCGIGKKQMDSRNTHKGEISKSKSISSSDAEDKT